MYPNIAVILTDAARKIIWVNEDFTQITGYNLTEVIGKKPGAILQGPASDTEAIQRIRRALQMQLPLKDQITNYRKNGEPYTCKLVIHPIFNTAHELTNFIAFEIDGDIPHEEEELRLLQLQEKYRSSSLKGIEEMKLFSRLTELLEGRRLYLDPNLSLRQVADMLATNTKYLSQVVNNRAGMNFQQFINQYRVEEAKTKIINDSFQNLTLFGIALQCGFKNKSTFYKVFKETTGKTPKEFIQQQTSLQD